MTLDIDRVIESIRESRDAAVVTLTVAEVDALLAEITATRRFYDEASTNVWRLEDWIGYIDDHTSDPEIKYYCSRAITGDFVDVLDDPEESDDAGDEEATSEDL